MTALLCFGCPRVLYLDYQPSTSIKGSGPVRVDTFIYDGHPTGLMKQKEVESTRQDAESLYLSMNIGDFFTIALKRELVFAGYDLRPDSARIISGVIENFFLDYAGEDEQRFQSRVTFTVARLDGARFTSSCHADRQQAEDWMKTGLLIQQGIKGCIDEFMTKAQAAGAL